MMKLNKKIIALVSTAVLAIGLTGCTTGQAVASNNGEEIIVATYNQGSVIKSALDEQLVLRAGMQVTLDMIDQGILNEVLPVTDEINASVEETLSNIKTYYKGNFEDSLAVNGFENEEAFKTSLTLNEQKNQYVLNYITEQMITDEDVQTYYDAFSPEIEASHILISSESDTPEALKIAEDQAEALIVRIEAGEDFGEIAKEFSVDTGSGANGGALGTFSKGQMVPEFETAAYALKIGEMTQEPVKSQFGYHIIKRTGGDDKKTFDEMKADILNTLATEKLTADSSLSFKALVTLREANGIDISDPIIGDQYKLFSDQVMVEAE